MVYSPKLTAVEAAQFEGTTQGTTERLVQRIPYAVLCQQLQQERLSVKEEVSKAVQACERKHASERRDLLNARAEAEDLRVRKRQLEEALNDEEARLGDKHQQFVRREKSVSAGGQINGQRECVFVHACICV